MFERRPNMPPFTYGPNGEVKQFTFTYDPNYEFTESHEAKKDKGKPKISLVPPAIIEAVAKIREYGTEKYGDPENWRKVERERYWDAYLRHTLAEMHSPGSVDEESGLPHIWHAACNLAFIIQLDADDGKEEYEDFVSL